MKTFRCSAFFPLPNRESESIHSFTLDLWHLYHPGLLQVLLVREKVILVSEKNGKDFFFPPLT